MKNNDQKMRPARPRLYHLILVIAVFGVACAVLVLNRRRNLYRSACSRYETVGHAKLRFELRIGSNRTRDGISPLRTLPRSANCRLAICLKR